MTLSWSLPRLTKDIKLIVVVWLLSCVWLFMTRRTPAHQASLSFTISWDLLKLMSIESVTPSKHLILCCPLLLTSIFPSIRVFSNELALRIRWPNNWSFSFSISPSNEYSGLIFFRIDWFDLLTVQGTLKCSPTPQLKSINSSAFNLLLYILDQCYRWHFGPVLKMILWTGVLWLSNLEKHKVKQSLFFFNFRDSQDKYAHIL